MFPDLDLVSDIGRLAWDASESLGGDLKLIEKDLSRVSSIWFQSINRNEIGSC